MTQFVGVKDVQTLVRAIGPERFMTGLAAYIAEDFARWPDFEKAARVASHSDVGVIELMPTSEGALYAFKYVNGHPKNTGVGKLTVTAFGVLADVATGYPLLVSEMTVLTGLRTAATSAFAARLLARPDSRTLALIGTGAQAEFQALAFKAMLGIADIRIFDTDPAAMDKFERNLGRGHGLTIRRASSAADAVRGADIVTTCTADKTRAVILTPEMIEPGMHINAIGGDCPGKTELSPGILDAAKVFVEFTPQSRIEGEIQQMPADFAVTELWEVLAATSAGRMSVADVTVFDSVGFAIEDFSTLRYVRDVTMAGARNAIDLVPELADPKDLFGLVRQPSIRVVEPALVLTA